MLRSKGVPGFENPVKNSPYQNPGHSALLFYIGFFLFAIRWFSDQLRQILVCIEPKIFLSVLARTLFDFGLTPFASGQTLFGVVQTLFMVAQTPGSIARTLFIAVRTPGLLVQTPKVFERTLFVAVQTLFASVQTARDGCADAFYYGGTRK